MSSSVYRVKTRGYLEDMNIVHVRGTPASSKTRLSELLRDHYRKREERFPWSRNGKNSVTRILGTVLSTCWEMEWRSTGRSHHDFITTRTGSLLDFNIKHCDTCGWGTDDLQCCCALEHNLQRLTPSVYKFQLCLFCSYGQSDIRPRSKILHSSQVFWPTTHLIDAIIGLFYDKEEFKDVVSGLLAFQCEERFNFDEDALEYMFVVSNGHPGAVTSIVDVIYGVRAKLSLNFFLLVELPHIGAFWRPYLSKEVKSSRPIAMTSSMDISGPWQKIMSSGSWKTLPQSLRI